MVNNISGAVENCAVIKSTLTSVEEVEAASGWVVSGDTVIFSQPSGQLSEVFTLNGVKVATVEGEGSARLASGVYIVRSGNSAGKIMIR